MNLNKTNVASLILAPFLTVGLFPVKAGITHFPETFKVEIVNGVPKYVGYTYGEHTIKLTSIVNPPPVQVTDIKSVRSIFIGSTTIMVFYSLQNNPLGKITFRGDVQTSLAHCNLVWTGEEQVLQCNK